MPSPPLPFEGFAMNVEVGKFLIYSSNSYASSGNKNEAGVKLNSSGKNLCNLLRITQKTFFFAKC